jgi:hypothetical protein
MPAATAKSGQPLPVPSTPAVASMTQPGVARVDHRAQASVRVAQGAQCIGHVAAVAHPGQHITFGLQTLQCLQHAVARHTQRFGVVSRGRQAHAGLEGTLLYGTAQLQVDPLADQLGAWRGGNAVLNGSLLHAVLALLTI